MYSRLVKDVCYDINVGVPRSTNDIHVVSTYAVCYDINVGVPRSTNDIHVVSTDGVYYEDRSIDVNIYTVPTIRDKFHGVLQPGKAAGDALYAGGGRFPITNRPRLSCFGSMLIEDLLIHDSWGMEERGYVTGVVTFRAVPVQRTLRLYHRDSGKLLSTSISDPVSGEYTFDLPLGMDYNYFVICFNDGNVDFNSIVHDWVIPEVI